MEALRSRSFAMVAFMMLVMLWGTLLGGLVQVGDSTAASVTEARSCTVSAGTCQVVTTRDIVTLTSVIQTVPISADETGDSTVEADNRTITITTISSS